MEILLVSLIKNFVLPPGAIFLGVGTGYLLTVNKRRSGKVILFGSLILGFLFTLPIFTGMLASLTETFPPIAPEDIRELQADAIVVLAGGKDDGRLEYGGVTVSAASLKRIRYSALLHRALKLPILVSGGSVLEDGIPEALLMAKVLESEFSVIPTWIEKNSRNTAQNALFSADLLTSPNIILITNALHMPRSVRAFERAGFNVTAAPVASVGPGGEYHFSYKHFLPSEKSLVVSHDVLHEWFGLLWYSIRY